MGDAAPRGQRATEGADHGLILRRRRRRGGEIVTPSTWHPQFLRTSERVGTGRMSESSQRVGTGRTPLALRNKETIVPGDLQCLNHRSCENVLLIPPPRVPPGPRSSPLSTTHGTKQSTKRFSSANGPNTNPFSVWSTVCVYVCVYYCRTLQSCSRGKVPFITKREKFIFRP